MESKKLKLNRTQTKILGEMLQGSGYLCQRAGGVPGCSWLFGRGAEVEVKHPQPSTSLSPCPLGSPLPGYY